MTRIAINLGIVLAVGAEEDALDLNFIVPALGKERTNGPIGQAAGEDCVLGRPAFSTVARTVTAGCWFPAIRDGSTPSERKTSSR